MESFGFECKIEKLDAKKTVHKYLFTFTNLLSDLDQGFRKEQKLAIKFDVDTKPPRGTFELLSPITGNRLYKIRHYDLLSLFAGKLHAILFRGYTKGETFMIFFGFQREKSQSI